MNPIAAIHEMTHKRHLQYDGLVTIAVGRSRKETRWRNETLLWSQFVDRLSACHITPETRAEYRAMPKSKQDEIKDIGGFVGGELRGGRRKAGTVLRHQLITLDADHVTSDLWGMIEQLFDFACAVYSTHSHEPKRPRLRLVIPLVRPVSVDEYQAVSRRIAADIGIDQFDATTFEPHRLMYWPSSPSDVEPVFRYQDLPWQDPDSVLARYADWRDPASWPEPARALKSRASLAERQQDPREKGGIVGAFCRAYSVHDAIQTFLADVYEPFDADRYTYTPGSTTGGLVLYDDGAFAYSHHGTDPVAGRLVNAFDLVRLHKFGELDDEAQPGTPSVRLPSYTAMTTLASEDEKVRQRLGEERLAQASQEFGDADIPTLPAEAANDDTAWMTGLEMTTTGAIKSTRHNALLILENDPHLKDKIALNEFTGRPAVRGDLPWRPASLSIHWQDRDDEALRHYLEHIYGINSAGKVSDALGTLLHRRRFHPVREYLHSLTWDGVPRLDTLLIDLLGAADTPYVRAVTRKALVAAVARVMRPGCDRNLRHVARWHGHLPADEFGYQLYLLGRYYNDALIGPEANNHGLTTITKLRELEYHRIYRRMVYDTIEQAFVSRLGWATTSKTRPLMLDQLARVIRDGSLQTSDERLLDECLTFVRKANGKAEAQRGAFDDLVISLAIAVQMLSHIAPDQEFGEDVPATTAHIERLAAQYNRDLSDAASLEDW